MQRFLIVLALVLAPGLGWTAGGPRSRITVVRPPPAALRGPQRPAAPLASRSPTAASSAAAAGPPALWALAGDTAAQCRQVCARDRYFCDATGLSDDCASSWGQCAAACSAPNLTPRSGPTPAAN